METTKHGRLHRGKAPSESPIGPFNRPEIWPFFCFCYHARMMRPKTGPNGPLEVRSRVRCVPQSVWSPIHCQAGFIWCAPAFDSYGGVTGNVWPVLGPPPPPLRGPLQGYDWTFWHEIRVLDGAYAGNKQTLHANVESWCRIAFVKCWVVGVPFRDGTGPN